MKKIFTLFSALFMGITIFAAAPKPKSMLTIKLERHEDIRVVLDGRRFEIHDNALVIRQLEAGYHNLKVYREKRNGFHSMFGRRYELLYSSSIMIRPRTHVRLSIDHHGRARMAERKINGYGGRDGGYDNDGYGAGRDDDWDDYDNHYDDDFGYNRAMNSREFDQVLSAIQKEWYEGNKLKSATHIINTNFFTSAQVKMMLQLFTFENNKLDLAKLAYAKTVDQRNFMVTVDDVFSFDNSRIELARFIRNSR